MLHREVDKEKGKLGKCSEWLEQQLENGPQFSREIYAKAANANFSVNTVRRAMAKIGVKPKETRDGWKMQLPREPGRTNGRRSSDPLSRLRLANPAAKQARSVQVVPRVLRGDTLPAREAGRDVAE